MKSLPAPIPRRQFLRRGGLSAATAAMMPNFIPASALGRSGVRAPSERITMGFVGLGGQGSGHLMGGAWTYIPGGYMARPDVQVLAVCDVRLERRENALQRCNPMYAEKLGQPGYDGIRGYADFRELLARPDIDAVLLALPYHWAAPMSLMAMRAGKDVYCEKPVAITVREGAELVATARRHARVYQAGTQQRSEYGGKFRLACELVRNGRIGQLKEVYAYRQPGAFFPMPWTSDASKPVPPGFDWDLWLGPLPWRPYNGEAGHALSGCFIGDVNWSPHHYDIIQWIIDPGPAAPIEVWCDAKGDRSEDWVVHYRYANGVVVNSSPYPGEPVGGEGGACFVGTEGRIAVDRSSIVADPPSVLRSPIRPSDRRVYRAHSMSGNFLECVRSRRPTICDAPVAVYTINAILIGGISMILRRPLRWNPARSEFEGDAEANRLLAYTPRPPWHLGT